ncbi:MAG: deaminase domain-containing protein [Actinoallomurus sp.]
MVDDGVVQPVRCVRCDGFDDTEFKLLNYIANRLGPSSSSVSGSVRMYSELPACRSCSPVINQL